MNKITGDQSSQKIVFTLNDKHLEGSVFSDIKLADNANNKQSFGGKLPPEILRLNVILTKSKKQKPTKSKSANSLKKQDQL